MTSDADLASAHCPYVTRFRPSGWYPWGQSVKAWIASASHAGGRYELWSPAGGVRPQTEHGTLVDVNVHDGHWYVVWGATAAEGERAHLACYAPDGGERWCVPARGRLEKAPTLHAGDGCIWAIEDACRVTGYDLATGAEVAGAALSPHRAIAGVAEVGDGIVIELDREVWFVDRAGARVLGEVAATGRRLVGNGRHAISIGGDGRTGWVVAPGGRWSWWELDDATRGAVVDETELRLVRIDTVALPLSAFDEPPPAIEAGGAIQLRRREPPSLPDAALPRAGAAMLGEDRPRALELPPAAPPGLTDLAWSQRSVGRARIAAYRGLDDEDASALELCVDGGPPATLGLLCGHGNTVVALTFADITRRAFELACSPGEPSPLPPLERRGGDPRQVEALVRAFVDRSPLPEEPLARVEALAARLADVNDRISAFWYETEGSLFAADGVLACVAGARVAVLARGKARVYRADADRATVIIREHTLGALLGAPAGGQGIPNVALSAFSARHDSATPPPPPLLVELAPDERLVAVLGEALDRPPAHVEALVRAEVLRDAVSLIEAPDPPLARNRWGAVSISITSR